MAVFGLGDSSAYTNNFCGTMEGLHNSFKEAGALIVSYVRKYGHTFNDSKSIFGAQFCGLPLDEESESDMLDKRLASWSE